MKILSKSNLRESSYDYILEHVDMVMKIIDLDKIGIKHLKFDPYIGVRGQCHYSPRSIDLNPNARSFQINYRGHQYKKFGGLKDLTPGGVFAHEIGHALHFKHRKLLLDFKEIRRHNRTSITGYGTSHVMEDIAECARLYISNQILLFDVDQERYFYINKYAKKYLL